MGFVGADFGALDTLAAKFTTAGSSFTQHSSSIVQKIHQAAEAFQNEMKQLRSDAEAISGEIDDRFGSLDAQAEAVNWTGGLRHKHDEALGGLRESIKATSTAIKQFTVDAQGVVDGSITNTLTDTHERVNQFGHKADEAAMSFTSLVRAQNAALQEALGGE